MAVSFQQLQYVCFAEVAVQVCVYDRKKGPTELLESIEYPQHA